MKKSILRLAVLSTPLLLVACGEGWEAQKTNSMFPYGNQRTAGSGVVYVLAKMLPEKELKIEKMTEPKPVLDAEEIFTDTQVKSGHVEKKKTSEQSNIDKAEKHSSLDIENKSDALVNADPSKLDNDVQSEVVLASTSDVGALKDRDLDAELAIVEQDIGIDFNENDTIEVYENSVSQPVNHIIVPKKDFFDFRSKGKKSLDEIYDDDFISSF